MCEQVPMNEYVRACRHGYARVRTRVMSVCVCCVCSYVCLCVIKCASMYAWISQGKDWAGACQVPREHH